MAGVLRTLFDELWERAEPLPWAGGPDGTRHVLRLAAQTRFHAGVEAARRGWLREGRR